MSNATTNEVATTDRAIDVMNGPSIAQIDTAIAEYDEAHKNSKAAKTLLDEAKAVVLKLIDCFGTPLPNSERSRLIAGALNRAVMTRATTITVDEDKVMELYWLLEQNNATALFEKLFEPRVKHEMVSGAEVALKAYDLPTRLQQKVFAAFGQCITVSDKAPTLKIEIIKKEKAPRAPRKSRFSSPVSGKDYEPPAEGQVR